jgi:hypothetical protein
MEPMDGNVKRVLLMHLLASHQAFGQHFASAVTVSTGPAVVDPL